MTAAQPIEKPQNLRRRLERKYIRKLLMRRPKANPKELDLIYQPRGPD